MKLRLVEELSDRKDLPLEYDDITVQVSQGVDYWDGPQWDEINISWTYYVSESDVAEYLRDYFVDDLSSEEYDAMISNTDDPDTVFDKYVEDHFDELFTKYYDDLLDIFKSSAEEDAAMEYEPSEYDDDYDRDYGDDFI